MHLELPYFAVPADGSLFLNFNDFTKEVIEPGNNPAFPDGAVGLRVDDDFWIAAALPYEYRTRPTEEIVREFWPELGNDFVVCPDHVKN